MKQKALILFLLVLLLSCSDNVASNSQETQQDEVELTLAESFFVGLKQEFGALDKALQDNQDTIDDIAKSIGKGLSTAVIATGEAVRFLADNFETIQ